MRVLKAIAGSLEITEWDPVRLLEGGAPSNEYDIEIKVIVANFRNTMNETELGDFIYDVFYSKMGIHLNHDRCVRCASEILRESTQVSLFYF
jgi:hypothetical protein